MRLTYFFVYFVFPRLEPRELKHRFIQILRIEHPIAPRKLARSVRFLSKDLRIHLAVGEQRSPLQ